MRIYTFSLTDPQIINGCELPCFHFKITSDNLYQLDYIIFSIQIFKVNSLFRLFSYTDMNGFFIFGL